MTDDQLIPMTEALFHLPDLFLPPDGSLVSLAAIPVSEMQYQPEKRCSYDEVLEGLAAGKLLLSAPNEARLYAAFGLLKPDQVSYPTLKWTSVTEARAQDIFSERPRGQGVECHCVGQQICDLLGLGDPGKDVSGRGFRGRAYSQALRNYLLRRIHTIGYTEPNAQVRIDAFLSKPNACLVDIRFSARSRWNQSFRQDRLAQKYGAQYIHCPSLGNLNYRPEDRSKGITIADPETGILVVRNLLSGGNDVMLLCGCKEYERCHRKVVYELLTERLASQRGTHRGTLTEAGAARLATPHLAGKIVEYFPRPGTNSCSGDIFFQGRRLGSLISLDAQGILPLRDQEEEEEYGR